MDTQKICGQCRAPLPPDAPRGLCPACLMQAAVGLPDEPIPLANPAGVRLPYFGDYEIQDKIARGGMGVVYKARQLSLNRTVAIKMILAGRLADTADVERFLTEAEAAANLRHPNIIAIHEVGEHDGQRYFSMDFVDGPNLFEYHKLNPLTPVAAATLVKTIAEAVHHAHQRGTLHRDLKPQNVLIDSSGQPHLTDFGLAKLVRRDAGLTQSGAVMGSPSYMPPEQATARRADIGPPTDVYSVGAILYYLLTGHPPFVKDTPLDTLAAVVNEPVVPPSKLHAATPRDLETICLKCLEKEPSRRYFSARELAEELERFLNHEPILARPAGPVRRAWNWTQRHPWLLAGAFGCVALAMVCLAYGLWERTQFLRWRMAPRLETDSPALGSLASFATLQAAPPLTASSIPLVVKKALALGSPAVGFFWILPLAALALLAGDRSFRRRCRAAPGSPAAPPLNFLLRHASLGIALAALGMGFLLLQIRCWAWASFPKIYLPLELGAGAYVLLLSGLGLRMVWQAAGIHESSRFREVVEKSLEPAAGAGSWPAGKRLVFALWFLGAGAGLIMTVLLLAGSGQAGLTLKITALTTGSLWLVAAILWALRGAPPFRFALALLPSLLTAGALVWFFLVDSRLQLGVVLASSVLTILALPRWLFFRHSTPRPAGVSSAAPALWKSLAVGAVTLAASLAAFYSVENFCGERAWRRVSAELYAQGDQLDWARLAPRRIPDEQNLFAAPHILEWFTGRGPNALSRALDDAALSIIPSPKMLAISSPASAASYLAASSRLDPQLALVRQALQRPLALIPADYSEPVSLPNPNFVTLRKLAEMLDARVHCHLLLGQNADAFEDLTFLHQLSRFLDSPPPPLGPPETLVASMIEVSIVGRYTQALAEGTARHAWNDSQLQALQSQLRQIALTSLVLRSVRVEQAAGVWIIDHSDGPILRPLLPADLRLVLRLAPRGWRRQNMCFLASQTHRAIAAFDPADVIRPESLALPEGNPRWPYQFIAAMAIPNYARCSQTTGENQTRVVQALIACALERFRLLHAQYPASLEALVPSFLPNIPHGAFETLPPRYQLRADGSFDLSCSGSGANPRLSWPPPQN